ncbi:MAG: YaeQ family protein [Sutterellaceae bacterium]|nr:YaeQ family protein [Sutterellaceae bacterium]MDD7442828.1 YaeQ family protein [Sutterellaceae bacterium]MDY2869252.1 YaeQ family protein [Mesosutterella sp.]
MALGATIYKSELDISDLDRNYYASHSLTVARHPSETEGRMMLRLLAFCLWGSDTLKFADGLSKDGEPALQDTDDTGAISLWVELGVPTVKQLRKAAGRSGRVVVFAYGEDRVRTWWESCRADLEKIGKLAIFTIQDKQFEELAGLAARHMRLAVTIEDRVVWVADSEGRNLEIHLGTLKESGAS